MKTHLTDFFLPYQHAWINDHSRLKIIEKSRQVGITYADAFDSVLKASNKDRPADVWVSSRDEDTARLYLQHCKRWAEALDIGAHQLGQVIINHKKDLTAEVLRFNTGCSIYSLSSSPDALASRTGHIKLDEFALHKDGRELFRVAKGCTLWGFQLAIISTHRGSDTAFNELLRKIKEQGNPMGFSHHCVSIHDAVAQGLVDRINFVSGNRETRDEFLLRLEAECIDQEQWLQEYCCQPIDDSTAFITYEMLHACESPNTLKPFSYLSDSSSSSSSSSSSTPSTINDQPSTKSLYVGVDLARKQHLTVIDVGEKIGDVTWDRLRLELHNKTFSEIEAALYEILELPAVKRCCIDATGLGMQLAERAKERFGYKVEPVTFTPAVKEELAFALRTAFEDRLLRIDPDPKLRADLRGIKKHVTIAGNIRFLGEPDDGPHASGHCDRFWAKALRHHAATQKKKGGVGAAVVYDNPWTSDAGWSGGYTSAAGITAGLSQFIR